MLDSVRKQVAVPYVPVKVLLSVGSLASVPYVPVKVLLSVGSLASFGWLLSHDLVHPIVIYALQLYLSF